ncbi:MAG: hypothetical protein QOH49_2133 [Acidobacteriota bacterium]|jgi:hypothetical protein|nr:hypothetical protein [Acidobacteriota bacterium]
MKLEARCAPEVTKMLKASVCAGAGLPASDNSLDAGRYFFIDGRGEKN